MIVYPLSPTEEKTVRWSGLVLLFFAVLVMLLLAAMSFAH